jgi:hypothetical protein
MVNRSNGEAVAMTGRCFGYPHFWGLPLVSGPSPVWGTDLRVATALWTGP